MATKTAELRSISAQLNELKAAAAAELSAADNAIAALTAEREAIEKSPLCDADLHAQLAGHISAQAAIGLRFIADEVTELQQKGAPYALNSDAPSGQFSPFNNTRPEVMVAALVTMMSADKLAAALIKATDIEPAANSGLPLKERVTTLARVRDSIDDLLIKRGDLIECVGNNTAPAPEPYNHEQAIHDASMMHYTLHASRSAIQND